MLRFKDWAILLETVTILFLMIYVSILSVIAKDLRDELNIYRSLYKEESVYVRILQEECLKERTIYD